MIKDAFIAKGKPVILDKIRSYVQAVSKGGPAKNELDLRKAPLASEKPQLATAVAGNPATGVPASQLAAGNARMKENSEKEGFKTITMTERFSCRARDVYEMLMDVNRWKGFMHSNTRITKEIGGQFSLIDGSITWVNE
ncbi:hypothetical protein MA16_Dca027725 [Dendrobium catenatum]|uniref:Uncharacterized protein n=1 Tax=Dendrobium catenatum TaxID=906689 RepID=A0A2I0XB90_9ASPA|nr:hypothetical protein MA16_Dca027725 [Dendrobium catenatum]